MLFNSYSFILFFPIVLIVYFLIPAKVKYIWLLIASYFFYMCWNVKYILLILISTLITWGSSLLMENRQIKIKKRIVAICIISNMGILAFFKYFDFILDNINVVMKSTGLQLINNPFDIVLPVGISFYTFQAVSYTIDVYREEVAAEKNFAKYALFVSFFPQLVAGPIERSKTLMHQISEIKNMRLWDYERITSGAKLMLWGYFLKMVIADRLAIYVDAVWSNYKTFGSTALVIAAIFFSIQIYCDFNSYSTIAVGAARIMGINLMQNFDTPYFSTSIKDFWRRWHISLSTWLKDYVYIPLGGNRCSKGKKYFNLMVIFLVSGLWHGANWSYVIWGGLHGAFQIIGEIKNALLDKFFIKHKVYRCTFSYKLGQMCVTFLLVTIAWIFFRSETPNDAIMYIYRMLTCSDYWIIPQRLYLNYGLNQTQFTIAIVSITILIIADAVQYVKKQNLIQIISGEILIFRWLIYLSLIFFILIFGVYGPSVDAKQFIYFQF